MERLITKGALAEFAEQLHAEGLAVGTIEKYSRDLRVFADWLDGRTVTHERAAAWRDALTEQGYAPVTINSMLAALNAFFRFAGWHDCRVRFLKIQRRVFRDRSRELTEVEYKRLISAARKSGQERLELLLQAIGATGIRVSEVKYLTVEAARCGNAVISLKGKIRTILLPSKLCRMLLNYAKKQKIASGEIFLTGSGRSLSRKQIWAEMKRLCLKAGVEASKVFPHNLRHLFATAFYKSCKDIVKLADVLGHSSIETTRIYLISSGAEHLRRLNKLALII